MTQPMHPVGWWEIPVTDMPRAVSFYEALFGLELSLNQVDDEEMAWFPMIDGASGATGSLVKSARHRPGDAGVTIYFTAPDLDATLERAAANGGTIVQPRTSIGEHGFYGLVEDPEGNVIGLHSRV